MKKKNIFQIIALLLIFILLSGCQNVVPKNIQTQQSDENTSDTLIKDELKWDWIVKPGKYDDLFFIGNELIAVKNDKEKYMVINTNGEVVIHHEYDGISKFVEGVALVNVDGKLSYIDNNGLLITNNVYEDGAHFSESLAAVKQNEMWGFMDLNGDLRIECQFDDVQYDEVKNFHEGFAAIMKNNKWGFINTNGEICIDFKYDDAGNFSEGKVSVKSSNYIEGMDAWAYIDKKDNIVIDFYPYDASEGHMVWVGEFEDGIAFVSKTLYCVINSQGENVFLGDSKFFISALTYNSRFDVISGYIFIDDKMTIRKYGLMGLNGNQRLEPVFDYIGELNGEYVIVENILDGIQKKGIIKLMF